MKKNKLYIIIAIVVAILSISGSIAWYVWESTTNTDVSLGVCVPEISFLGGETLQGKDLIPTEDRNKGLTKEVEVSLNKTCTEGDSGVMNLYMRLDSLPVGLQEESFVYEIWQGDKKINSGNFANYSEGNTITLLTNQVITETSSIYKIYIYIDGSMNNPPSMGGNSFRFSLYSEGTGAIYEENTIPNFTTPSDSSSTFLNSGLARSDIESITIAEDNTVPEGIEGVPLSSVEGDDSVMLWYTDIDENELYEVYIGSDNGVVKLNTNAELMFAYLTNVEYLDLTNLDTSNVTTMNSMFIENTNLKELKISNFDTSNVTNMNSMFYDCKALTNLDLSSFDTSNVTRMDGFFRDCSSLTNLDLSSFNTSIVTNMQFMFYGCSDLTNLNLSSFDVSNVYYMGYMFQGCKSLVNLDLSNFVATNVKTMSQMFLDCSSLISLDLSGFNTSQVTAMDHLFGYCSSLTSLNLSSFITTNVTKMNSMFSGCSSLTNIDLSNFNTINVTTMGAMFSGCSSLTTLDLSSFVTTSVTYMSYMFENCSGLTSLDLSTFDTSLVTNMNSMFYGSNKLTTIYVSDLWKTDGVTYSARMFDYCTSLVGGAGTTYDSNYIDKTYARIDEGTSNPGYFTSKNS